MPNFDSQMRVALSKIVSKTGDKFSRRRLITCNTSEVAVCCCSGFAQLVEQPRVLDGDDGLSGEIRDQLDLSVGERQHFLPIDSNTADQLAFLEHRDKDVGAGARRLDERNKARFAIDVSRLDHKIGDGNNAFGFSQPRKRVTRIFAYPKNRIFGPALA